MMGTQEGKVILLKHFFHLYINGVAQEKEKYFFNGYIQE